MSGQKKQSDLMIVTAAKDLCSYVMLVTEKSPKRFRFTFVTRLQNLSLSVIENVYRANEVFILESDRKKRLQRRLDYQRGALTDLKVLAYFAVVALENGCILAKQFEQITQAYNEM